MLNSTLPFDGLPTLRFPQCGPCALTSISIPVWQASNLSSWSFLSIDSNLLQIAWMLIQVSLLFIWDLHLLRGKRQLKLVKLFRDTCYTELISYNSDTEWNRSSWLWVTFKQHTLPQSTFLNQGWPTGGMCAAGSMDSPCEAHGWSGSRKQISRLGRGRGRGSEWRLWSVWSLICGTAAKMVGPRYSKRILLL